MEPVVSTYTGQVYKLLCDDGHYYIGSTISDLKYRLYYHKRHSLFYPDRKVYNHILECGWDKVNIKCIEEVNSNSKDGLRIKENEYIKLALSDPLCLNIKRAHLTKEELLQQQKEYLQANKDKVDAYHANYRRENAKERAEYTRNYVAEHPEETKATRKAYYEANKTEIIEKQMAYASSNKEIIQLRKKEWAEKNKDVLSEKRKIYAEENKGEIQERGKKYYEENKEIIKEKNKVYREANREKMKEYLKKYNAEKREKLTESHTCECGGKYSWSHHDRHNESKHHKKYLLLTKQNLGFLPC